MANKRKSPKPAKAASAPKCAFQTAIEKTAEVQDGFCPGKQAIKNADRDKIVAADNLKLQGSLEIDSRVKYLYPKEARWDYALSYDNKTYYLEVHSAETSQIKAVTKKVEWLKKWLKTKATEIDKLPKAEHPYIWVPSGRYAILRNSKTMMQLSVAGLVVSTKLILK